MDAPTFINLCLRDLHAGLRAEVDPLSQDELLAIPVPGANSIAFLFWHFLRTEDEVLHRQVAGTDPISVRDNWAERWSVESSAIGTGFSHEQVAAFCPDKADLLAYFDAVSAAVPELVASVTPEALDQAPNPERPRATVGRTIANIVVGHGFWHLGDIRYTKGLMGKPFAR